MDQKLLNRLMLISTGGLTLAGIIFLCLYFFGEPEGKTKLFAALACILLANLSNIIRGFWFKQGDNK